MKKRRVSETPLLSLQHIAKSFPGVQALSDVSLEVRSGEVHAVLGENGAGKSTLIKVAAGVHLPDSGACLIDGAELRIRGPRHAAALGIAVIHQEPHVYASLSVLENLFAAAQPTGRFGMVDWRLMRSRAEEVFRTLGVALPLEAEAGTLSAAEQQLLQIARALLQNARVLIMDEPTSSLSQKEVETLVRIVKRLRDHGAGIVYITHRLDEVFTLADRVTVLRDGRHVATEAIGDVKVAGLVRMMVGREISQLFPKTRRKAEQSLLRVEGLSRRGAFREVSFEVRRGEIVGMWGLVGAGRSDVAQAIMGIAPPDSGTVEVDGTRLAIKGPWEAMAAGLAYVPEDRQRQGIIAPLPVRTNLSLAILARISKLGFVDRAREGSVAREYVRGLKIRLSSLGQAVGSLSGGNQQKVVLAQKLACRPRILLLDEPTRGIDVGAKAEVHRLMDELAAEGMGILMISSELPEVLGMSDRVLVMRGGSLVGELSGDRASQEGLMAMVAGVVDGSGR